MSDTSLVFNLVARDRASGEVSRFGDRIGAVAPAIGAGFGAALGAGVMASLEMEASGDKLAAQLGLTPEESERIGRVSGDLFADAYGDSMEEVNTAVGAVMTSIEGMAEASSEDLRAASAEALNFAKTFDIDIAQAAQHAGALIKSGLAKDATESFDLITAASGKVPAHLREDLLEASNNYGQFFDTLGFSGEEAFELLLNASDKGAEGIDKAGDALKEFTILSTDLSTSSKDAYEEIGLDAGKMANAILAGGDSAQSATQKVISGLLGIKDPATQANTAIALFGTPLEDLNVKDIPAFLKSLQTGSAELDGFAGASKRSGDALNDNASKALQKFKNRAMLDLAAAGGAFATFAMENQAVVEPLAITLGGLAALVLVVKAALITYSAVSTVVAGAHAIMTASAWGVIGNWLRMMGIGLMVYARIAGAAVLSAATTAAAWVGSALVSIGTWVAAVVRAAVVAVAQFALMAARAVAWAVVMAAQWLIAMGPVGWVIALIIGLVAIIIANWDTIKKFTGQAWEWVWTKIKAVGQFILNYIIGWKLVEFFLKHWDRIKSGTVSKVLGLISFVRGLPGRISSAIGNLGSLLYNKGRDIVIGLWNGIKAMGGWLRDTLVGWARNLIPGPIAKALGISSPSKVMAEVVGRWIPAGVVEGIRSGQGDVDRTMAELVRPSPTAGLAAGQRMAGGISPLTGGGMPVILEIRSGGSKTDELLIELLRKAIRVRGGNVQAALGGQ